MSLSKVEAINPVDFEKRVLADKTSAIICFWEDWSEPCKEMEPVIDRLPEEFYGRASVYSMDLESSCLIAAKLGVTSIPAVILFVGGEPVQKLFGSRSLEDTVRTLEKHLEA